MENTQRYPDRQIILNVVTLTTGGVTLKSCEFSVKSFSLSVADMMTSLSGLPFCKQRHT